jgi:hypothetical protein
MLPETSAKLNRFKSKKAIVQRNNLGDKIILSETLQIEKSWVSFSLPKIRRGRKLSWVLRNLP